MSVINKYKKDVKDVVSTNLTFDSIKNKIHYKKVQKKTPVIVGSTLGGLALIGTFALIIVVASRHQTLVPKDQRFSSNALAKSITPLLGLSFSQNDQQMVAPLLMAMATQGADEGDKAIIQDLLGQFDTIISNEDVFTVKPISSIDEDYRYQTDVTFNTLLDEKETYSLFYNEISVKEEVDDDEIERESFYEGVAKKDDKTFDFHLLLSEELENDEIEVESQLTLYKSEDKKDYIEVIYESEIEALEEEKEYLYRFYENNQLKTTFALEIEKDLNKDELELILTLNEKEYSIERKIIDGETYFYVELKNKETGSEIEYIFKKVITDGQVTYILIDEE